MIDRADFVIRIAAALYRGSLRRRLGLTIIEAAERARQVADALPSLFRDELIVLD